METVGAPHSSTALRHSSTRQTLSDGALVFADAAAAGAGQIAGVQRLEHEHKRETLVDHGMHKLRLFSGACVHDDLERIGRVVTIGALLPLRRGAQLVLCDVSPHAEGHGKRKSHNAPNPIQSFA